MSDKQFVAAHALRWGEGWLQEGELLPDTEGRNLYLMQRLGQIHELQLGDQALTAQTAASLVEYQGTVGELLPGDYPGRSALFPARIYSEAHVAELSDEQLAAIKGIGAATLASIRERTPIRTA